MRKLKRIVCWWWMYLTSSMFRQYVHAKDIEDAHNEILRMMREKAEYESRIMYQPPHHQGRN